MFEIPKNKIILTSVIGERKVVITDSTDSIHEDMDLVVDFFRAIGFQNETIIEAFEAKLWEIRPSTKVDEE